METGPQLTQLESLLWERNDAEFLQRGRQYVATLNAQERSSLAPALWHKYSYHVDQAIRQRSSAFEHLLRKELIMPADVERDGRELVIADMNALPGEDESYATVRYLDLMLKGWPVCASLIELDGRLEPMLTDMPTIYFVHEGDARITVDGNEQPFTNGMQAAIPSGTNFHIEGKKSKLYALECAPNISGDFSLEDFNDERKKNKCPCGWSYRIPLVEKGWKFSTHRTVMSGHDPSHGGFMGHQHQCTPEIYFTHSVKSAASITLDGVATQKLSPGMLVAIPNGTMHGVDSGEETIQHIYVGGGHKDDFWQADWNRVPKS